jgi:hypothetical protein
LAASIIRDSGVHGVGTVHSLMGPLEELTGRMSSQVETYDVEKVQYLSSLDTIIIDEISMISAVILEQIECVCRVVKRSETLFGGIQMILIGDFKQLNPVPNVDYGHVGQYVFESKLFIAFSHIVQFHEIYRYVASERCTCFIHCILVDII